jgi:hypothetical protein
MGPVLGGTATLVRPSAIGDDDVGRRREMNAAEALRAERDGPILAVTRLRLISGKKATSRCLQSVWVQSGWKRFSKRRSISAPV